MDKKDIIIRGVKSGCITVGVYVAGRFIGYNVIKLYRTMRIRKQERLQTKVSVLEEALADDDYTTFVIDPDGSVRRAYIAKKKSEGATEEEIFELEETLFKGYKASRKS